MARYIKVWSCCNSQKRCVPYHRGTWAWGRFPQVKDLSTDEFLSVMNQSTWYYTMWSDLCDRLPDYPPKVILAKARQLIKKGIIGGCACGCRGDFYFPLNIKSAKIIGNFEKGWYKYSENGPLRCLD